MSKEISSNNVYKMAEDFKNHVESEGKVPYKFTYGGIEFTTNEMQDILTYELLHLNSGVKADTYKWCKEAKGDNIIEDIYKDDYLNQAERVRNYILHNGQVPNYVTTVKSKKKVNIDLYTYCVSKILVWYKNHGKLPNYCTYDYRALIPNESQQECKNPFVSSPHYTEKGCNRLGQCTPYDCGPHSVHQILKKFGVTNISEEQLMSWMGTTTSGTGHAGIESGIAKAAKVAGIKLEVTWKNFSDFGSNTTERFQNIGKLICQKNIGVLWHILYSGDGSYIGDDGCGHYEVLDKINVQTKYVRALNSLGSRCNYPAYCGHLQDRSFSVQTYYLSGISQKSICIIKKV